MTSYSVIRNLLISLFRKTPVPAYVHDLICIFLYVVLQIQLAGKQYLCGKVRIFYLVIYIRIDVVYLGENFSME